MNKAQYLEHLGIGGRVILKPDIKTLGCEGAHWIYLAHYREK
jgi:hypothetical protein